jgi:hypothetical protein
MPNYLVLRLLNFQSIQESQLQTDNQSYTYTLYMRFSYGKYA